jgi:hypothetical protein
MSEYNSLKELYRTAQTTAELDLFFYTGLPIVGRDGLVLIVADVTFECTTKKTAAVNEYALHCPRLSRYSPIGTIWRNPAKLGGWLWQVGTAKGGGWQCGTKTVAMREALECYLDARFLNLD